MFDLGWSELLIIGIVALIVVGPKDLPGLFRTVGRFTGKARAMAREFSRAMEAAADESGVREVSKSITEASRAASNPTRYASGKAREATKAALKPGSETEKLSEEREAARHKIAEATARAAEARKARQAAPAEAGARPAADPAGDAPARAAEPAPAARSDGA